jgi:hypothetical protein
MGKTKEFRITAKAVKEFMANEPVTYASGDGKKFKVLLKAGPHVERYLVEKSEVKRGFVKLSDAVRCFNSPEPPQAKEE